MLVAAFARKHGKQEVGVASTEMPDLPCPGLGLQQVSRGNSFFRKRPSGQDDSGTPIWSRRIMAEKNYDPAFALSLEYSDR
ncbi:MAG: hypothetical protein Ct9H90mP9_0210 [Pseudomonadota bacterium]|nr:MAG: hypothetical protein Ct9H90mP9_0210 [Pseudomonadota bacterium]